MSVKPISIAAVDNSRQYNKNKKSNVSFTGFNPVVGLMDFIESGGYAASFILQDGIGFVIPRVGKGIFRDSEKKDANGNIIYKPNGKPEREYNWGYAKKEGVREIVTGPSAFIIPLLMLKGINKFFGRANNVKLNYIDTFKKPFADMVNANPGNLDLNKASKTAFYENVYSSVITETINNRVPDSEKLSHEEIMNLSQEFAGKQVKVEEIMADKTLTKKVKAAKIAEIGTVEDAFMKLKKSKIGGAVDELSVKILSSNGKVNNGSIGELVKGMGDYFDDATRTLKNSVKENLNVDEVNNLVTKFSNKRMGSRLLVNAGLFAAVAAFMTQIPKLYNLVWKDNRKKPEQEKTIQEKAVQDDGQPSFTGRMDLLEKAGKKVFNNKNLKKVSDIFELNGSVISGTAMPVVLYGFCIPPRMKHAKDKYDYGEIVVRDFTSFTAILFGAKALARVFSDGFTKLTGLALNKKNMTGRNGIQKVFDYLNPVDTRHHVLSTKELTSKYTKLQDYKGGVDGFVEFIEKSGGDIKKALSHDKEVKDTVSKILKGFNGKAYSEATTQEIKAALKNANAEQTDLIKKFYDLFTKENKILSKAKTCNSAFGFLSTLVFVPAFIIWLANVCERMTANRTKKDLAEAELKKMEQSNHWLRSNRPSMAGFLGTVK